MYHVKGTAPPTRITINYRILECTIHKNEMQTTMVKLFNHTKATRFLKYKYHINIQTEKQHTNEHRSTITRTKLKKKNK